MNVTLIACDKDSSGGYTKTYQFNNANELIECYLEFQEEVPFSRWYLDISADDYKTEEMVEGWLNEYDSD